MSKNTDKQNAALINTLVCAANVKQYTYDEFAKPVTLSVMSGNDLEAIRQRIMHLVFQLDDGSTKCQDKTEARNDLPEAQWQEKLIQSDRSIDHIEAMLRSTVIINEAIVKLENSGHTVSFGIERSIDLHTKLTYEVKKL